jgi:hypothetical protein
MPLGGFKNGFDLLDDSHRQVAVFRGSAWREGGQIIAGRER